MADWSAPMTKLQAVNVCLSSMGEPSIETLDGAGLDAEMANSLLDETSAALQNQGWYWNTENHNISPDWNGFINLPNNVAKADTTGMSLYIPAVLRGTRFYNPTKGSYVYDTAVDVEMVLILPWTELQLNAKLYITAVSAFTLQQRILGAESINKDLKITAKTAHNELVRAENEQGDYNMLTDSLSTVKILYRGSGR